MTVSFDIAGGTNFVPWDILTSTSITNPVSEWTWLGIGYTTNRYTFTNQPSDVAFYKLARPINTMTVAWGNNQAGEGDVPWGLSNVVQVAGGLAFSLGLLSDGSVVAWGADTYGQTTVPTNAVGASMVTAGLYHSVALLTNGSVVVWGYHDPPFGEHIRDVPDDLTNAAVISALGNFTLALRSDGSLTAWGYSEFGETNAPAELTNATAIAAGFQHGLAVKVDGTVAAWGRNNFGQCTVPAAATNVWDVAAGVYHSMALKLDGTVICWGDNSHGECNVPASLSNVVAIAAGGNPSYDSRYSAALKSDGTVEVWGAGAALWPVVGLSNVIAIAGGAHHALGVRTGPKTPVFVYQPQDHYQVAGGTATFQARATGVYGVAYQWQYGGVDIPGATSATLTLTNVQLANEGNYCVVVSNEVGTLASSTAGLTIVPPPAILSQTPATNPAVYYQAGANMAVTAAGIGQASGFPLSYQWRLNGTNIAGATEAAYSFVATAGKEGQYSVTVSNAAGSTNVGWDVSINYGTLAYYLSTNTSAYTNGHASGSSNMLLLANWAPATYTSDNMGLLTNAVWSTNCWLKGVQGLSATAIGISNNYGGQFLLTMVSPRHYLRATHVGAPPGLIAFLDTNNIVYWRATIQWSQVGSDDDDTGVGILDEDLPASVGYLPVLPTDWTNYLPRNASMPVQGIGMNQDMLIFGQPMTFEHSRYVNWNPANSASFGLGTNWNVAIRGGDSSDPERLLINKQCVLVTQHFRASQGPNLAVLFDAINQKMHYLSTNNGVATDYQLTPFAMTNWPSIH